MTRTDPRGSPPELDEVAGGKDSFQAPRGSQRRFNRGLGQAVSFDDGAVALHDQYQDLQHVRAAQAPASFDAGTFRAGLDGATSSGEVEAAEAVHADLAVGDFMGRVSIHAMDIVDIVASGDTSFQILVSDHRHMPELLAKPQEWEFKVETAEERDQWIETLSSHLKLEVQNLTAISVAQLVEEHREVAVTAVHGHRRQSVMKRLGLISEWFGFPIVFCLELTVPECIHGPDRKRWPITFVMAMVWLAMFSYLLCTIVEMISADFGIDDGLLGLTLAAAGTSFPNLVASVVVARQGQSSMAIANAIGSNIQNVFLALGWPWLVKCMVSDGGRFEQSSEGIVAGVIWMGATLLLFIVWVALGRCALGKIGAYIMAVVYVGFVIASCVVHH